MKGKILPLPDHIPATGSPCICFFQEEVRCHTGIYDTILRSELIFLFPVPFQREIIVAGF